MTLIKNSANVKKRTLNASSFSFILRLLYKAKHHIGQDGACLSDPRVLRKQERRYHAEYSAGKRRHKCRGKGVQLCFRLSFDLRKTFFQSLYCHIDSFQFFGKTRRVFILAVYRFCKIFEAVYSMRIAFSSFFDFDKAFARHFSHSITPKIRSYVKKSSPLKPQGFRLNNPPTMCDNKGNLNFSESHAAFTRILYHKFHHL